MDYEKKYKEALKDASYWMKEKPECKDLLKGIFPELAESEDERIRKGLIDIFNTALGQDFLQRKAGLNEKEVIAYLEKQKEQKPADEQFPPLEGLDAIKAKYYDDGFKNGFDEGVESVKPAEWSEEDEKMLNEVLDSVTYAFYDQGNEGKIEDDPAFLWLHRLRPSWKPSEEQMSMLLAVIRDPNNAGSESCSLAFQSLYEDLRKLI